MFKFDTKPIQYAFGERRWTAYMENSDLYLGEIFCNRLDGLPYYIFENVETTAMHAVSAMYYPMSSVKVSFPTKEDAAAYLFCLKL